MIIKCEMCGVDHYSLVEKMMKLINQEKGWIGFYIKSNFKNQSKKTNFFSKDPITNFW